MHNHWNKHLNIRKWFYNFKPTHVVEVGAGTGELSRLIAEWKPNRYTIISDTALLDLPETVDQIQGISYQLLPKLLDNDVDCCIIDTDHNYWTLRCELDALHPKLREDGIIMLHDVATFYHGTGMAMRYWEGTPYPTELIEQTGIKHGGLGNAVIDFLSVHPFQYRMLAFTSESNGACILQKQTVNHLNFMLPGPSPAYAPETREAVETWMKTHNVEQVSCLD